MFTNPLNLLPILSIALTATTVLAAPTQNANQPRQTSNTPEVTITLIDATQHQYPVSIPSTQTWTPTNVPQSISTVQIENTGYVPCAFFGVDGAVILSMPGNVKEMAVGPPQTIVGGICGPLRVD